MGNIIKNNVQSFAVSQALRFVEEDPEENIPLLMDMVDRFFPKDYYPGARKAFFQNFILNASLQGSMKQMETSEREDCNVPWAILLETIDSIIRQGKELGIYMYIYTGGEPLVRKKDLFFTNSVLLGVGLAMDAFSVSMANGLIPGKCHAIKNDLPDKNHGRSDMPEYINLQTSSSQKNHFSRSDR